MQHDKNCNSLNSLNEDSDLTYFTAASAMCRVTAIKSLPILPYGAVLIPFTLRSLSPPSFLGKHHEHKQVANNLLPYMNSHLNGDFEFHNFMSSMCQGQPP